MSITFTLERDASGTYIDVYCEGSITGCITDQSSDTTSHKYVYTSFHGLTTYTEEGMRTILNMLVNLNCGEV